MNAGVRRAQDGVRRVMERQKRLEAAPRLKSDAELIAEAIENGKLRKIPRGVSGDQLIFFKRI